MAYLLVIEFTLAEVAGTVSLNTSIVFSPDKRAIVVFVRSLAAEVSLS
jgi:hypothetical protein